MLQLSHAVAAALAVAVVSTSVSCQQDVRPVAPHEAMQGAHGVFTADGEVRALAGGVDVAFEAGRVVVTPLLGDLVSENRPLTLELAGVGREDGAWHAVRSDAAPVPRGRQVDYRHGAGIVERYVARPDGIKQSVLIERPMLGSGDLVVRMAVTTELECAPAKSALQLDFEVGALGGVHIGTVVGIDASGARQEGVLRFDGQFLEYVLPASFVEDAVYPLDVDPLLSGGTGTGRSFSDNEMDIAYDLATDTFGVVYQSEASATDRDLYVQFLSGAGARLGGPILIASNGHRSDSAKIASNRQTGQFLVAWQDNGAGDFDIKCRSVDPVTRTTSPVVDVAATAGVDETTPDVGGDSTTGGAAAQSLVVWDGGSVIQAGVVSLSAGPPVVASVSTVLSGSSPDFPVITKDGGVAQRWFVAANIGGSSVIAVAVDSAAAVLGVPATMAISPAAAPYQRLDIAGNGEHFTVVMEELEAGSATDRDIRASHGVWNNALLFIDSSLIESDPGFDESRPCIALLDSKYAAAWIDVNANTTDIEASNLELDSAVRCGREVVVSGTVDFQRVNPAIASCRSGGAVSSDLGLLGNRTNDLRNGNAVLRSRLYSVFAGGPVNVVPGTGTCSNGAATGVEGECAVGNQNFTVTLSGADQSAQLAILGVDPRRLMPIEICGTRCGGLIIPDFTVQIAPTAGTGAVRLPIPCDAGLSGGRVYLQWLVLGTSAAGSCTLLPGLRASDALEVTIGD